MMRRYYSWAEGFILWTAGIALTAFILVFFLTFAASGQSSWCAGANCADSIGLGDTIGPYGHILKPRTTQTTAAPTPRCDDGWTLLIYPGTNRPICARDLRKPQ